MTLYFENPDHQGHQVGPDDPQITEAVVNIDRLIGRIIDGLHYVENDRIPPIIGLVDEGFKVEQKKSEAKECGGAHGYDNAFFSMRTIFIGHGPMFLEGKKVASFENVEIYNKRNIPEEAARVRSSKPPSSSPIYSETPPLFVKSSSGS
ncbi:unnamed protein product [Microthlaspi erraticum]|uniref:Uncharacterized protein n=1 Tax=Microthlaspi erraticum TaxID=1685480 RepID=A0A6D2JH43_9BRAS|nr:unnamed protein product [Microthlaspi erraticum]